MSEILICAEDVGKKFCRDFKKSLWYGIRDSIDSLLSRESYADLRQDEFWANQNISFEVARGQSLGLIGRNGAGKTTLLKMLSGLIKPETGRIQMKGRVGALIALGAGFNPILTARENIFVNAAILGFSRGETREKLDEIIDFSGVEEFLDTPIQSFSSGMSVRLGFAIASCVRPDILLVDEVLAVGDADFRLKCHKRIREVLSEGCAVVLVSHNTTDIARVCTEALWLEKGMPRALGQTAEILAAYAGQAGTKTSFEDLGRTATSEHVTLQNVCVKPLAGKEQLTIKSGASFEIKFECKSVDLSLDFTLEVNTEDNITVFHSGGAITEDNSSNVGQYTITATIPPNFLNAGNYSASVIIGDSQSTMLASADKAIMFCVGTSQRGIKHHRLPGITAPVLEYTAVFNPIRFE